MIQTSDGKPSIPEPFWVRTWRTLLRWKPACYKCSMQTGGTMTFPDRREWEQHWLEWHYE